jgi:hypothetical protein
MSGNPLERAFIGRDRLAGGYPFDYAGALRKCAAAGIEVIEFFFLPAGRTSRSRSSTISPRTIPMRVLSAGTRLNVVTQLRQGAW